MDERIKNEYRKIYSELLLVILCVAAVMQVVKYICFGAGMRECSTEFIILIGSPIYLSVRRWMLGIEPDSAAWKGRLGKRLAVFIGLEALLFFGAAYLKNGGLDAKSLAAGGGFLAVFALLCVLVAWTTQRISVWFADRKSKKYED